MSLWEDVKSNLVELYTTTSEKTSEIARVTTRKYDKFGISRDIERQFSELGNLIYTGMKEGRENILEDPAVEALRNRIDSLEEELSYKEEEIDSIRQEYAERKAQNKAAAAAAGSQTVAETVITDPVLEPGTESSAILVEPADMDMDPAAEIEVVEVDIHTSNSINDPVDDVVIETDEITEDVVAQELDAEDVIDVENDPDKEKP